MTGRHDLSQLPRGLRNNNPLNIRRTSVPWLGKLLDVVDGVLLAGADPDFERFHETWQGIRAAIKNAQTIERRVREAGEPFTVLALISTWAPASDGNDTAAYASFVARKLGDALFPMELPDTEPLGVTEPMNHGPVMRRWVFVEPIIRAMVEVENGMGWQARIAPEVYRQAARSAGVEGVPPEADESEEAGQVPGRSEMTLNERAQKRLDVVVTKVQAVCLQDLPDAERREAIRRAATALDVDMQQELVLNALEARAQLTVFAALVRRAVRSAAPFDWKALILTVARVLLPLLLPGPVGQGLLALVEQFLKGEPLVVPDEPKEPDMPNTPPPPPPAPVLLQPDSLGIEFDMRDRDDNLMGYRIEDKGAYYQVIKTDGTTALPLRSILSLRAVYQDEDGEPFRFEDQVPPALHLYGTAQWSFRAVDGSGKVTLGPARGPSAPGAIGGVVDEEKVEGLKVVNFKQGEAQRTGLMDVPAIVLEAANDKVLECGLRVTRPDGGIVAAKPVRFPLAS